MSPIPISPTDARRADDRLSALRSRIDGVRRQQAMVRCIAGYATLALAVLAVVAAVFAIDWLFGLPRFGRVFLLLAAAVGLFLFHRRFVAPWLTVRESDIDIALAIEKRQGIDSDIVAALEFDRPDSVTWGSADLRTAVIDYVADFGRSWAIPREVPAASVVKRLVWLAAAAAVMIAGATLRPDVAGAFVNRMLLGSAHYPTRTRIESLTIGGRTVDVSPGVGGAVSIPVGRPLEIEAGIGGVLPAAGRVRLRPARGAGTSLELVPGAAAGRFEARLPKLLESVELQVFAGDAWTDPLRVVAIAAPVVDATLTATPPAYVDPTGGSETLPRGARQVAVIEGSRVGLDVRCANKRLASATLVIDGEEHPLKQSPDAASTWLLPDAGSPLACLVKPTRFEVRVVDEDGLPPDVAVAGLIRIRPDGLPRVSADVLTRLVLPTAAPRVVWRATDDHGLREVTLVVEPLPAESSTGAAAGTTASPAAVVVPLVAASAAGWVGHDRLPVEGTVAVPLASLGLRPGDQVRLTVRAADYRGKADGRTATSDPILLDITDESGIIASLSESDERSAGQLEAIIERELKAGGTP
jgi:hypothetical protein